MKALKKTVKPRHIAIVAVVVLTLVAALGLVGCGGSISLPKSDSGSSNSSGGSSEDYADLDPVTLIMADSAAKGATANVWCQEFANQVSEITGGKLTIDYHGTGDLGGDTDLLRQAQSNDIQLISCQPAPMVSFISDVAVFDLPMAFTNYDGKQIDTAVNGDNDFTKGMQASFEEAGLHNLGWLQNATFRETTSNKPLKSLGDFKGLQICTMENKNHMAFWQAIGAEPTPLAWAEVFFALQNGTVEAQENGIDTCAGAGLQEVQKYLAMTDHILYINNMSISKECWDNLDPAYQAALEEAFQKSVEVMQPKMIELQEQNVKTLTDGGMEVIEYDQSFYDDILANDKVKQVYKDISGQTDGLSDALVAELEKTKNS